MLLSSTSKNSFLKINRKGNLANTSLAYISRSFTISASGTLGKKAYALSNNGQNQTTVILPHKGSGALTLETRPFPKKQLTIFAIGRYEVYDQMSRGLIMGGLNLWI